MARFRLGHTRVTHSYLLLGEEHPQCVGCDAPFTVRHFLLECGDFAQVKNNCFHVGNMKQLFQDIHIDSIMTFLRQIKLFNKIYFAIFKILFCFTFVSDHNIDSLMLYSVQLKNMYSYLNSSLKLSDIVRGLSCQQSYCNSISLYKLIYLLHFFYFFHPHHVYLIPSDANDPQGLMRR